MACWPTTRRYASDEAPAAEVFGTYPNPATGTLHVQLGSGLRGAASVRLLDKFGAVRSSAELTEAAAAPEQLLDLAGLPAGVYYVQVITGQQVRTQRVVKE